jgi:phosphatidylglycerophosphate synthase
MAGGRTTSGVVRVGDTICRPLRAQSPFVHQLSNHLESNGFRGAPRFLGIDERKREILSFIPGDVPLDLGEFSDAVCLVEAFLSDIFDGVLARHLRIATANLRRLDSVAGTLFYAGCVFAAWHLYPMAIKQHLGALAVLGALELMRYILDFLKFRREASYHMWSSKVWGIGLFAGFFGMLVMGSSGAVVSCAIYLGIVADVEGLLISLVLPRWQADVPTILHALRVRRAQAVHA